MALLLGGANIALADESGGFVGIGVGYGDAKYIVKQSYNDGTNANATFKSNGASYGFVAGYKQFFNEYLGLRYYANVDLTHASFKMTADTDEADANDTNETYKFSPILVNYGINVDFLGNFVVTEIADFGGFIGLGIGGNTWTGKNMQGFKTSSFDVGLNVGLRTNIATNHGLEVAVRVPFLKTTILEEYEFGNSYKFELGQNVRVLARYTFSF